MTTTTDTLTRWLPLWEQDEGLRPTNPIDFPAWIDDMEANEVPVAEALVRDSAVQWLAERAQEPCIMPDGSLTLEAAFGARFGGPFAGPLSDALYEACKAVLGEDTI